VQGILCRVALGQDPLGFRRGQKVNELPCLVRVWRVFDQQGGIRHEGRAERVRPLLIRNQQCDRFLLSKSHDGVIFVKDANVHSTVSHAVLDV
jgi:hypothetical protein